MISKDLDKASDGRLEQQRALNLVKSGEQEMVLDGLDRIYENFTVPPHMDVALLDELKAMLLENYESKEAMKVNLTICKILLRSGSDVYQGAVKEVLSKTSNAKLQKHLQKMLQKAGVDDDDNK